MELGSLGKRLKRRSALHQNGIRLPGLPIQPTRLHEEHLSPVRSFQKQIAGGCTDFCGC